MTGPFKKGSHNARLLAVLSDGREHSHRELYGLGIMLHSRVADLRKAGYQIEKTLRRDNGERLYCYRLVRGPLSEADPPPMIAPPDGGVVGATPATAGPGSSASLNGQIPGQLALA